MTLLATPTAPCPVRANARPCEGGFYRLPARLSTPRKRASDLGSSRLGIYVADVTLVGHRTIILGDRTDQTEQFRYADRLPHPPAEPLQLSWWIGLPTATSPAAAPGHRPLRGGGCYLRPPAEPLLGRSTREGARDFHRTPRAQPAVESLSAHTRRWNSRSSPPCPLESRIHLSIPLSEDREQASLYARHRAAGLWVRAIGAGPRVARHARPGTSSSQDHPTDGGSPPAGGTYHTRVNTPCWRSRPVIDQTRPPARPGLKSSTLIPTNDEHHARSTPTAAGVRERERVSMHLPALCTPGNPPRRATTVGVAR